MSPHILQTPAWGQFQAEFGWKAQAIEPGLILFRRLPLGFTRAYVPRGPNVDWREIDSVRQFLSQVDNASRAQRAISLIIEPDWVESDLANQSLSSLGLRPILPVQPRRSLVIDLSGNESDILARMKQKTRYNIGLAAKKGVSVTTSEDIGAFTTLMAETATRDDFHIHPPHYYRRAYEIFRPLNQCALFMATFEGQPLAGVMAFVQGDRAWYFYGASSNRERNRMAPYLAQWEAMRWAKSQGAVTYDLWGVPDEDEATLEEQFENRHDGLWGVYRFKRGWGGTLTRAVGAWEKVYQPLMYRLYQWAAKLRRSE